ARVSARRHCFRFSAHPGHGSATATRRILGSGAVGRGALGHGQHWGLRARGGEEDGYGHGDDRAAGGFGRGDPQGVRVWVDRGLLAACDHTPAGYQLFAPETVDLAVFIRRARVLGLS
ncbi:MAG: hypothetical protein ACRDSL_26365, partial [Pseudonocardiaceae bacterium]